MKILCDFDGVICKRTGIPTKEGLGRPMPGGLDAITLFMELGHKVLIFTSNPKPGEVKKWLKRYHFPELQVTNIKEPCHMIIDDRAVRFTNWQDIRKYIC